MNQRIKVNVVNTSDSDFTFDGAEVIGSLEELDCIIPAAVQFREKNEDGVVQVSATTTGDENCHSEAATFSGVAEDDVSAEDRDFYQLVADMEFSELNVQESELAKSMLWEERNVFGRYADDIGSAPELQLDLQTTDELSLIHI